ncbi:hypothetical protein [Leucobacter luti]|uniref:hypothetical protein n=1 Tax=Leucobacter luti TaxID=340320 RepID=UPI003CFF78CD
MRQNDAAHGPAPASPSPNLLVMLSSVKWNFAWQRHHSLARAAAEAGMRVVFVEPHPRSWRQAIGAARRALARLAPVRQHPGAAPARPRQAVPSGVAVLRWTPLDALPGYTAGRIRARAGATDAPPLVIQYVPSRSALSLARRLRPAAHLYDRVLDWASVPRSWHPPRDWEDVERQLLSEARLMTDSAEMQEQWQAHGRGSLLLPPAADEEFVEHPWSAPPPDGPVGYFGTVQHDIVDVQLLCESARHGPVEVVGSVDDDAAAALRAAGVRVRPQVPLAELPAIIDRWSAILLPYRVGARRETLVPAKVWNAIATRRPVFTSGLSLPAELTARTISFETITNGERPVLSGARSRARTAGGIPTWTAAWAAVRRHASAQSGGPDA